MDTLLEIRTNIFHVKNGEKFEKHNEIIFLVDKPNYKFSNEGLIIRERTVEQLRLVVRNQDIDNVINILNKMKQLENSDLK